MDHACRRVSSTSVPYTTAYFHNLHRSSNTECNTVSFHTDCATIRGRAKNNSGSPRAAADHEPQATPMGSYQRTAQGTSFELRTPKARPECAELQTTKLEWAARLVLENHRPLGGCKFDGISMGNGEAARVYGSLECFTRAAKHCTFAQDT